MHFLHIFGYFCTFLQLLAHRGPPYYPCNGGSRVETPFGCKSQVVKVEKSREWKWTRNFPSRGAEAKSACCCCCCGTLCYTEPYLKLCNDLIRDASPRQDISQSALHLLWLTCFSISLLRLIELHLNYLIMKVKWYLAKHSGFYPWFLFRFDLKIS